MGYAMSFTYHIKEGIQASQKTKNIYWTNYVVPSWMKFEEVIIKYSDEHTRNKSKPIDKTNLIGTNCASPNILFYFWIYNYFWCRTTITLKWNLFWFCQKPKLLHDFTLHFRCKCFLMCTPPMYSLKQSYIWLLTPENTQE